RDPDERQRPQTKKENELDPNAQLEKETSSNRSVCCGAARHSGLSLRAQNQKVLELTVCGQSANSLRLRQGPFLAVIRNLCCSEQG
ncbi:hypothetical protein, partial [uncultured Roseobacter sp.]|uniref:hypothetical protein n=1 Tax=uncultured Roseobacter sp. TaxID=114847 RepID=UPI00262A49CB